MRLIDYMQREAVSDETFAVRFNADLPAERQCSAHAVKKWKYGERRPDPDGIIRIEDITAGVVSLRDWATEEPVPEMVKAS